MTLIDSKDVIILGDYNVNELNKSKEACKLSDFMESLNLMPTNQPAWSRVYQPTDACSASNALILLLQASQPPAATLT